MRRALVFLLMLAVSGCGFLKRPPNQFYSLETVEGTVRNVTGLPVGIDGIQLPPGLDRRGIVVRGTDNRFEVRGTHQWASDLEEMVIHTLAFNLASRLPNGMVIVPGQAKPSAMRALYVTFEDLAAGEDGVFVLDARWTLIEPGAPERAGRERITVTPASKESAALVTAMNQALAQLADRLVAGL
ncbi:MAG TPA: PqiC family protein [Thermoanaerobaculia bacterium]